MTVREDIRTYNDKAQSAADYAKNVQWAAWRSATSDGASNELRRVAPEHQDAVAQAIHDEGIKVLGLYGIKPGDDADEATIRTHLAAEGLYHKAAAKSTLDSQGGDMSQVGPSIVQRHGQTRQQMYRQLQAEKLGDPEYQEKAREEMKQVLDGSGVVPRGQSLDEFLKNSSQDRLETLANEVLGQERFDPKDFANRYAAFFKYAEPPSGDGEADE